MISTPSINNNRPVAAGIAARALEHLRRARGGALVLMLMLCAVFAVWAVVFVEVARVTLTATNRHVEAVWADMALESAVQHAEALLRADVAAGPADTLAETWMTAPHGGPFSSTLEALRSAAIITNLEEQHWFELPGPTPLTRLRYRFKLADAGVAADADDVLRGAAAYYRGQWRASDDINAADATRLSALLQRFDVRATDAVWCAQASARLADDRDINHALQSPDAPETEALRFEQFALAADLRWNHLDDTLRLGRYYEERGAHNYFLVSQARAVYNPVLGRTNIMVELDETPSSALPGWNEYRTLRAGADLPRWYPGMWRGITAATGSGLPEGQGGLFKHQPVFSNTTAALVFDDARIERYEGSGGIRQTVTFDGWFSSLNELKRAQMPSVRARGALFTTAPGAPDGVMMTNLARDARYQALLVCGAALPRPLTGAATFDGMAALQPATFDTSGIALLDEGRPITPRQLKQGDFAELLVRAPQHDVSERTPFYLEGVLLRQPAFITLRNTGAEPLSLRDWRIGYRLGSRLFWLPPLGTTVYYSVSAGRRVTSAAPVVAPGGLLVVTPDADALDWFVGAVPDGSWGGARREQTPAAVVGWERWSPRFAVSSMQPGKEITARSTGDRALAWETEWHVTTPDVDWRRDVAGSVIGEVVTIDPDGDDGTLPPLYGMITAVRGQTLTVRLAGGRARLRPGATPLLTFGRIPRVVQEFWLVTPDGRMAGRGALPDGMCAQAAGDAWGVRAGVGRFKAAQPDWNQMRAVLHQTVSARATTNAVRNAPYGDAVDKLRAVDRVGLDTSSDWYVPETLYYAFNTARGTPCNGSQLTPDRGRVARVQEGWWHWDAGGPAFPSGAPGLLYAQAYLEDGQCLAVRACRQNSFAPIALPGVTATQVLHKTVVLGPSRSVAGTFLFGAGGCVFEWDGLPPAAAPVTLTIAGMSARRWQPPASAAAWTASSSTGVVLNIAVWNHRTAAYDILRERASFDAAERLQAGQLRPDHLRQGVLRLRVTPDETLRPGVAELWLQGVYLHPVSRRTALNVNTASPRAVLERLGATNGTARAVLSQLQLGQPCRTFAELARRANDLVDIGGLGVMSDRFSASIEAQVVTAGTDAPQVLATRRAMLTLDRGAVRLVPGESIRRRLTPLRAAHVTSSGTPGATP